VLIYFLYATKYKQSSYLPSKHVNDLLVLSEKKIFKALTNQIEKLLIAAICAWSADLDEMRNFF
jgi:hypothetical protein